MRRIALFAHYDAGARVRPFVLHSLKELRTVCEDVVFVSTAGLSKEALDVVRPYCGYASTRENVGFDFAMWRDAMERVDGCDELVLTNSSVFGPFWPLAPIFETMAGKGDGWGMTDSVEIAWHLQSYFLVFRKRILESKVFREFWRAMPSHTDKERVIRECEVGLSRLLKENGFVLRAFAPQARCKRPLRPPFGARPFFDSWSRMLRLQADPNAAYPTSLLRAGMPFVKHYLLRDNPLHVPLEPVVALIKASGWDTSMLEFDRPVQPHGFDPKMLNA